MEEMLRKILKDMANYADENNGGNACGYSSGYLREVADMLRRKNNVKR